MCGNNKREVGLMRKQNGKQGEVKNLADANAAAEASTTTSS